MISQNSITLQSGLERYHTAWGKSLTSDTAGHTAGLVGQLQGIHVNTAFASYSIELIKK